MKLTVSAAGIVALGLALPFSALAQDTATGSPQTPPSSTVQVPPPPPASVIATGVPATAPSSVATGVPVATAPPPVAGQVKAGPEATRTGDAPVVPQTVSRPSTQVTVSDFKEPTPTTTYLPVNPVYNISTLDQRLRQYVPGMKRPTLALMTAGQPMPQAWKNVADSGIRTVINLRHAAEMGVRDEASEVRGAGLNYIALPVAGAHDLTAQNAKRIWTYLQQARGGVLVHCGSGDRTGALLSLAAYREGHLSKTDALEFGKRAGLTSLEPAVKALLESEK